MYVDILILSQLMQGPKHGYEIKKDAEHILGDTYKINHNSLYPILKHLEEMGAIEKRVEIQEGKPNRHVYMISPLGQEILIELMKDFPDDVVMNDSEFFTRVGLFSLIERENQQIILNKRKSNLLRQQAHYEKIVRTDEESELPGQTYAMDVIVLLKQKVETEIAWLNGLLA